MNENKQNDNLKRHALGKQIAIGSSSEGNAYLIEINRRGYQKPFRLLIEAGFPLDIISKRLLNHGLSLTKIDAVLVTHEHNDHAKGVPDFINKLSKHVYAPKSVFKKYGLEDSTYAHAITYPQTKIIADGIEATPIPLVHKEADGSNVENYGYIIKIDADYGDYYILFITDTHYLKYNLSKYQFNVIYIEANNRSYAIVKALEHAKAIGDKGREIQYDRVLHSHMLVENTAHTLVGSKNNAGFDLSKTDMIFLIHLSTSNQSASEQIKYYIINALKEANLMRKWVIKKDDNKVIELPRVKVILKNGEIQ